MTRRSFVLHLAVLLTAISLPNCAFAQPPAPVRISMANSFVVDQPKIFVDIAMGEFKAVTKAMTGLNSEVNAKHTPSELADKLNGKQVDFAMLYAHEFAWAQKKYPDLRPLLIAATKKRDKRVHIIVHKDSPAKTIADLRGKKLDLPLRSKEYCRLYLEKLCAGKDKGTPADFFGAITKSASQVAALDQVARKETDALIIDTPWLDYYQDIKGPVFDKNLRVLVQSEVVPPAVLAYNPGALPAGTVDRVRDGLRKAHTDLRGRALLALWLVESFETVPKDYEKSLAEVLKEYPPPAPPR